MIRILVTGSNGQLGSEIRDLSKSYKAEFLFLDRDGMDIGDEKAVRTVFEDFLPNYCINCAAYTAVDQAESDQDNAFKINEQAVEGLIEICNEFDTTFIHISTDFVFDGISKTPYAIDAATFPLSVYGRSKLGGEQAVMQYDKGIVIRTSWVYSSYGKNFLKTMIRLGKEKTDLNVVADQVGVPTYAHDLANVILKLINKLENEPQYGMFHYSNKDQTSWFHFAKAIMKTAGLECEVHPIDSGSYPTAAARPRYSVLDTSRIEEYLGLEIRSWKEAMKDCMEKIEND